MRTEYLVLPERVINSNRSPLAQRGGGAGGHTFIASEGSRSDGPLRHKRKAKVSGWS